MSTAINHLGSHSFLFGEVKLPIVQRNQPKSAHRKKQ